MEFSTLLFCRFLLTYRKTTDIHWQSQVSLCNPCLVNYDYVIDFDDLARQSNRLLRFVQNGEGGSEAATREKIFFDEEIRRLSSRERFVRTQKHLDEISKLDIYKLYLLYEQDFEVFSYDALAFLTGASFDYHFY